MFDVICGAKILKLLRSHLSSIVAENDFWKPVSSKMSFHLVDDGAGRHARKEVDFEELTVIIYSDEVVS